MKRRLKILAIRIKIAHYKRIIKNINFEVTAGFLDPGDYLKTQSNAYCRLDSLRSDLKKLSK